MERNEMREIFKLSS